MRPFTRLAFVAFAVASPALAETPSLPPDAVQLKGADIGAYLDGKRFSTVIYDADVPITATVNWDLEKRLVFGNYVANGTKGTFKNEWIIKGNTSCGERNPAGKLVCQKIYVSGDTMYEVNKNGGLHAVSTVR